MGTINNPGHFDCLAKLDPDEPYFLLRGKDPKAQEAIKLWCLRSLETQPAAKIQEALQVIDAMDSWQIEHNIPLASGADSSRETS